MKNIKYYLLLSIALIFGSCGEEDVEIDNSKQILKNLKVVVEDVKFSSVTLKMSADVSDKSKIEYEVYLSGKLIKKVSENKFSLSDLKPLTDYSGKVIAISTEGKKLTKAFKFKTLAENKNTVDFSITTSDITANSVKLMWEASTLSGVTYTVEVDGKPVAENITKTVFDLNNLDGFTSYKVKVTAQVGKTSSISIKEFKTLGIKPSTFKIITPTKDQTVNPENAILTWEASVPKDNSKIEEYEIYLDDEYLTRWDETSYTFDDLEEGKTYKVKVVAISTNELKSETDVVTFKTSTFENPSDFTIEKKIVTTNSIAIKWTPSKADNQTVEYNIYLNNEKQSTIEETSFTFDNLDINTEYTIKVIAITNKDKKTEKTIKITTTDYLTHPTIKIDKAILYTKNSSYFGDQLQIEFNTKIEEFSIVYFSIAGKKIGNYMRYPYSIMTGYLGDDYEKILNAKTGFILIKISGETYKLNFEVTEESN